uniref:Uncharacterized protein n=1 Tax=uncultured marine virus TaxID=186617 RepID=A0A0F7LB45_9VIRU|nr:hypothetical protein [uncultured marine virus]
MPRRSRATGKRQARRHSPRGIPLAVWCDRHGTPRRVTPGPSGRKGKHDVRTGDNRRSG